MTDDRLVAVTLDGASLGAGSLAQDHERRTAIHDLLADNRFGLVGYDCGPYRLVVALRDGKLALDLRTAANEPLVVHHLSLKPLRGILRDYAMLRDSHVASIRIATPDRIEALDMGRRGLHDDGAERLRERLDGKIAADFPTLRRLFTLVSALHWRG